MQASSGSSSSDGNVEEAMQTSSACEYCDLNVVTLNLKEPTAKLYRWSWYGKDKKLASDPTVGYFSEKTCLEAANRGRAQLDSGDAAELMITTREVDTWSNSQELVDGIVACLCMELLLEQRPYISCQGCIEDRQSLKHHLGPGGCITTPQQALATGEFDHVYDNELPRDGIEHVYHHAVEDLKLGWTTVPLPDRQTVETNFKGGMPLLKLQGRPYQEMFLYHWRAYNRKQANPEGLPHIRTGSDEAWSSYSP